jgi:hypothetical protein
VIDALQDAVTAALRHYADRGVFRGFRAVASPRRRVDYQFQWLTRQPMRATFDAARGVLSFPALFPHAAQSPGLVAELRSLIDARATRAVPAHKRVDARRARIAATVRQGALSLSVQVRGSNHEYAVKHVLGVINELFVALHQGYPDYLIEHFGISAE